MLGITAAALGIDRNDEANHAALERDWAMAVRIDAPGTGLLDYHTVQYPPSKGKRVFRTRRDELIQKLASGEKPDTKILSRREYLQDAVYTVCLFPKTDDPVHSTETIVEHLKAPTFAPYLGRRSCPPALPFNPEIVDAAGPVEALAQRTVPGQLVDGSFYSHGECDAYIELTEDVQESMEIVERRDAVLSRAARQFVLRSEVRRLVVAPSEQGETQ